MKKKRIFVYSEKVAHIENIRTLFQIEAYEKDKNLEELFEIKMVNKIYGDLPWDYDAYILHVSDTEIEQIEKLRETRPSALICGLTNPEITTNRVYGLVDKAFKDGMDENDFKYFLMELYKK